MKTYFAKTPGVFRLLFPKRLWVLSRKEKNIYLTFDDGPIPEVTPWILAQLKEYNAKATFFCIGKNVDANPEVFQQILNEGHEIGNHTHNHLNGSKTATKDYIANVLKAQEVIREEKIENRKKKREGLSTTLSIQKPVLFRPPYGKLSSAKAKALQNQGFKIVMWDVLSGDFDQSISKEKCLKNVLKNTKPGSIVIFHDSIKAKENLYYALPKTLAYFKERGFEFKSLN